MQRKLEIQRRRSALSNEQRALLEKRIQGENTDHQTAGHISPRPAEFREAAPLSCPQLRFWFLDALSSGQFVDPLPLFLKLHGPLDIPALEQSLHNIMQRHESLRTTFARRQHRPVQIIAPFEPTLLTYHELSILDTDERDQALQRIITAQVEVPFDLEQGPLFRTCLVRLAPEEHILLLCLHHIISDGWSLIILRRELLTCYQSFSQGLPVSLAPLPLQYADFATWQVDWLKSPAFAQHTAYWTQKLAGLPEALHLPTDYPRPARQTFCGTQVSRQLPSPLLASLTTYARSQNATLFMTLLATLNVLLWGYTGQDDIAIGTIIANRNHLQTEQIMGLFTNTLVMRSDLSNNPTFQEFLRQVRRTTLDAYEYQDMPFEKLVEILKPRRDPSRSPLFQVLLLLQNLPTMDVPPDSIAIEAIDVASTTATYDLTLYFTESSQGLLTVLEYNTDLFTAETMHRLLDHLHLLLEKVCMSPEIPLATLILALAEGALP